MPWKNFKANFQIKYLKKLKNRIKIKQKKGVSEKVALTIIITCHEKISQAIFDDNLSTKYKKHNLKILVFLIAEKYWIDSNWTNKK